MVVDQLFRTGAPKK